MSSQDCDKSPAWLWCSPIGPLVIGAPIALLIIGIVAILLLWYARQLWDEPVRGGGIDGSGIAESLMSTT